jgi:hypothetical protein
MYVCMCTMYIFCCAFVASSMMAWRERPLHTAHTVYTYTIILLNKTNYIIAFTVAFTDAHVYILYAVCSTYIQYVYTILYIDNDVIAVYLIMLCILWCALKL